MCSRILVVIVGLIICISCSQYRKIELVRSGGVRMSLTVPEDVEVKKDVDEEVDCGLGEFVPGEPFIMNAVLNEETGEMVATDILTASSVTARFRNVAERAGYVTIGFDINVPAGMAGSRYRLKIYPRMTMGDSLYYLDPVMITGSKYREGQLRGYERYRRFISSIITDTTDLIWTGQLEIFLRRHFPDTYKMKNDSSLVSDPQAETLFGATQEEALRHYTRKIRKRMNQYRIARKGLVFKKFVKDPIVSEGIRLDTVFNMENGDFVYSYLHTFRTIPFLKKVTVSMTGSLYADGQSVVDLPQTDELTFYISTLSSLIDDSPKYNMVVVERNLYDNIKVFLDFKVGSSQLDTTLGDNALQLQRIRDCMESLMIRHDCVLDSVVIVASCSPEGSWKYNDALSERRSNEILEHIKRYLPEDLRSSLKPARIPENWEYLKLIVEGDTLMTESDKKTIISMIEMMDDPDRTERLISRHPQYPYIKRCLYPQLRSVTFDFHLHRVGMVKDTVHTTELDTLYIAGLNALRNLDYKTAVEILAPYRDYNAALAYASAGRNYSSYDILKDMDDSNPKVCYLMAVILSRLGMREEALMYFEAAKLADQSYLHRANLDPELSDLLKFNI